MHRHGFFHRDIKPENVMVDKQGHAKIIDFGLSKILEQKNKLRTFTNCGTTGYTAPEILQGFSHDFAADIWSFGILIVELLTG